MSESRLDRGTKIYVGVLTCIALAILVAWWLSLDTRAWEINGRLEEDTEISAYPSPVRVLETANGVAVVASPRSFVVPTCFLLQAKCPVIVAGLRLEHGAIVVKASRALAHGGDAR